SQRGLKLPLAVAIQVNKNPSKLWGDSKKKPRQTVFSMFFAQISQKTNVFIELRGFPGCNLA
ncbi:MAG: hypothetical protein ABL921_35775, partial [Pirellula sp.]